MEVERDARRLTDKKGDGRVLKEVEGDEGKGWKL